MSSVLACIPFTGCLDEPTIDLADATVNDAQRAVLPETCNGRDDDLDEAIDEGLKAPAAGRTDGVCVGAMQVCRGEAGWQEPDHNANPDYQGEEGRCDGLDNDCDGLTDEATDQVCGTMVGACREGVQRCVDGLFGECLVDVSPTDEVCDGLDNDCDGTVDEVECECLVDEARACGLDVGLCREGTQGCVAGEWGPCIDLVGPEAELCNGLDDDCDGTSDEGEPEANRGCDTGQEGLCGPGLSACREGVLECTVTTEPGDPICDDGIDQDCDADSDEFRNACGNCGDQFEAGASCRRCFTLREEGAPQAFVSVNGTIDTVDDEDFYCVHLVDNLQALEEVVQITLSNTYPMGHDSAFRLDLYRNEAACTADDALISLVAGGGGSRVGQYSEGRNDLFARPIDDTGNFIIKISANMALCEIPYLLRVGAFD